MMPCAEKVIVSGRVRLARNYHDLPFSTLDHPENALICMSRAREAMERENEEYTLYQLNAMPQVERLKLVEKHLISRDLLSRAEVGAALIRADRRVSIMMNEEDHLRIQAISDGQDLSTTAQDAFHAEETLEAVCTFSFDPQLGYLTSCPTNTGTGMRASLMMHLPMLTRYKQMGNVNQSVAKLGLTIRGIYGEGSEALGDLYQVSNQVTLGRTEEEIIEAVSAVGKKMIDMEIALRERALKERSAEVSDALWRSYGLLLYARQMDEKEFMQHWSRLRLGVCMGVFDTPIAAVDELLTIAQSAHARRYADEMDPSLTSEQARCEIIRKTLTHSQEV